MGGKSNKLKESISKAVSMPMSPNCKVLLCHFIAEADSNGAYTITRPALSRLLNINEQTLGKCVTDLIKLKQLTKKRMGFSQPVTYKLL